MHKIVAKWDMQEAVRESETELGLLNTLQNILNSSLIFIGDIIYKPTLQRVSSCALAYMYHSHCFVTVKYSKKMGKYSWMD